MGLTFGPKSGLGKSLHILVQTVCNDYQQTTTTTMNADNQSFSHRNKEKYIPKLPMKTPNLKNHVKYENDR